MDAILARAVVEAILFLEFSNDGVIEEDAAVQQLESIAGVLRGLDTHARNRFVSLCNEIAHDYDVASGKAEFVRSIPVNLGIVE